MSDVAQRLHELLGGLEDPLVAGSLRKPGPGEPAPPPGPAQTAAAGPRAAGNPEEYELLVALIREGHALHYAGRGSVLAPDDPDLALLLGDRLYAMGLERLAALGDLDAVGELADVIALCAQAHAESDPGRADAVWEAGAAAVGWGASADHAAAKELSRRGDPSAEEALRAAAHDLCRP